MKKNNFLLHIISFSAVLVFIVLLFSSRVAHLGPSYAYEVGACDNMTEDLLTSLENGSEKLTYECFGAVGDGRTNDFEAFKKAHAFANKEYVDKGIFITVHGTSGKNYYIGANSSAIPVATSTNFHGANVILDDGADGVDPTKVFLKVVSPMYIKMGNNSINYDKYLDMDCIDDDSTSCVVDDDVINHNVWKNLYITTSTTNIKSFVDSVLADTSYMDQDSLKYFQASQIWVVNVTDSSRNYIRSGSNADNGKAQTENILVNRVTGDIIGNINWNYNDMIQIKVWPVPEKNVVIQNGNFTTLTNNVAFGENGKKMTSSKRNIQVAYTGNVTIQTINHYLDESVYPNNNGEQVNPNANGYYGFISLSHASYINIKDVNLTPHSYTKKTDLSDGFASYDLIFDHSLNLFFDNVGYACKEGETDCYENYMVNSNRWGIVGSNGSKNVFIRNSKLNRIDSHKGLRNLYVENTTVGDKGFTLTGSGSVYLKNVSVDGANSFVSLRADYGSTWNGTLIMEDVEYLLPAGSGTSNLIYSNNNQNNYGYTTYFPDVYLKNVTLNNQKYSSNKDVTVLRLSENTSSSGTSKYKFKGNVRFTNVKFQNSGNNLYLFTDGFVSNNDGLLLGGYSGTNTVEIGYTNNDSSFKYAPSSSSVTKLNSSQNTKFTFKNSSDVSSEIDSKIASLSATVAEREEASKMPEALEGDFELQSIMINNGSISLNESISPTRTQYTTDVSVGATSVKLEVHASGKALSVLYPDIVSLTEDTTTVTIKIVGIYGATKTYTLDIRKTKDLIKVIAPTKDYCKKLTFNAQTQTLTNGAGTGYTFRGNTGYKAGDYTVTAILKSGYQWSDGTLQEKTFVCSISKGTPNVTFTSSSLDIPMESKATFVEYSNVKGKFQHTSKDEKTATVTPPSTLEKFANTRSTVTVTGVKKGTTSIDVTFTPTDIANYEIVKKSVAVNVKDKAPEVQKVEIPSASSCTGAVYNGSEQEIAKVTSEGYTLATTKATEAGVYTIKASLKTGYVWSDGTAADKNFQCELAKASPSISVTPASGEIAVGSTLTITESSALSGVFENVTSNAGVATVTPNKTDNIAAGEKVSVTVSGVSAGTVSITVRFTSNTDSKNFKSSVEQTFTYNVTGSGSAGGGGGDPSGGGTVGGQKVIAPTSTTYCNEVRYTGQPQMITKEPGEGFHFVDNVQTDAGEYPVKAVLNSGYQWDDSTISDKTIDCTLKKAIPIITLNVPNKQILLSQTANFTETANVKGTFMNSSIIPGIASISAGDKSEVMAENSPFTVSVSGLVRGLSIIQVDFSPVDAINWETTSKRVRMAINDKMVENYQDSNISFTPKEDKNYFASESFLYTGNDNNNSTIENSLTFRDGVDYEFRDNSLVLKDSSGTEKIITLVNIQTDLRIEDEVMYISEEMSLDKFKGKIQTNGVTISVEKMDGENVTTGSIVNVYYQDQIVDTYVIKIKAPVVQKTGEEEEEEDFLFGLNPILLIVGAVLIVAAILVLIFSRKNKKPKFIQQGPGGGGAAGGDPNAPQPGQYDIGQGPNMGPYLQ